MSSGQGLPGPHLGMLEALVEREKVAASAAAALKVRLIALLICGKMWPSRRRSRSFVVFSVSVTQLCNAQ